MMQDMIWRTLHGCTALRAFGHQRYRLGVMPLRLEDDWQRCRPDLDVLEGDGEGGPWASWTNWHNIWRFRYADAPCWYGVIAPMDDDTPALAAIWRVEAQQRRWGNVPVLRTLDWMVLRQPAYLTRGQEAAWSSHALTHALSQLHHVTGCACLSLYNQPESMTEELHTACAVHRYPVRVARTTWCPQIAVPVDIESFFDRSSLTQTKRVNYDLRHLHKATGTEPRFMRVRGGWHDAPGLRTAWDDFLTVWRQSWQWHYQEEQGAQQQIETYITALVEHEGARGTLDISLLKLGEQPIAGYLSFVRGSTVWMVLGNYVADFKSYSVGVMTIYHVVRDSAQRGDTLIDLGGESLGWKRLWATHDVAINHLTLPATPWTRLLDRISRRGRTVTEEPLTEHAVQSRTDYQR